ncbi:MAG TPA: hypothetical protein DC047_15750 [Blastocatellia bacterium]|nr:hypothetical protein [Blastocatellia bacterium]
MLEKHRLKESLKSSTRSVRTNLARPFKAGNDQAEHSRRVATLETRAYSIVATRRKQKKDLIPALKRRAKLVQTLRVKGT